MRRILWGLSLAVGLSAIGCSSSADQSYCEKAFECNELQNGETVDQCVSEAADERKAFEDDADCKTILEKSDDLASCAAGLSCEEREKILSNDYKCKDELQALADAVQADNGACAPAQAP